MKGIAILGTGPAGLMAAQACAITGRPFSLFGAPGSDGHVHPSVISGAQFMHVAVPTVSKEEEPDFSIRYRKFGTAEGYAAKVYASDPRVPFVSFNNVNDGEQVPAWSLRSIYETLWHGIAGDGRSVNALRIDARTIDEWVKKELWDAIICTIPRNVLCRVHAGMDDRAAHSFLSQSVAIIDSEDMGVGFNEIHYNGDPNGPSWYRSSNIAGWQSTEWADTKVPPYYKSQARVLDKPISHTCDCWAGQVTFAGRFGKWEKGVLVQDGFIEAFQAVSRLSL